MPILTLKLSSKQYSVEANENEETQTLRATASIVLPNRQGSTFHIQHDGKTYDGYAGTASISICKRPPRSANPAIPTSKPWSPDEKGRDILRVDLYGKSGSEAYYQATLYTEENLYQRITEADLRREEIFATLENEVIGQELEYGNDPDGNDIVWNIDSLGHVFLRKVTFSFCSTTESPIPPATEDSDVLRLRQVIVEQGEATSAALNEFKTLLFETNRMLSRYLLTTAACVILILFALMFR
jgi:hypothetical protein